MSAATSDSSVELIFEEAGRAASPAEPTGQRHRTIVGRVAAEDLHVLVIDDQSTMRSILRRLLDQVGIRNVSESENGEAALELLRQPGFEQPDVIISDLHMDTMDGMQFCNLVRREKAGLLEAIPVIILTGEADKFLHEVARQVGAARILTKPIAADDLLREIEETIGFALGG